MSQERTDRTAPRESKDQIPAEPQDKRAEGQQAGSQADEAVAAIYEALERNKRKKEMDTLVDEIDEVLEENAEEFVKNYVQRGGQ